MPSHITKNVLAALASVMLISACESVGPSEEHFGEAVRNFVSHQQLESQGPLEQDEPIASGNGRRLEAVITVHQSHVGDPGSVVNDMKVEGSGSQ
jgi:hypothetical protein